MQRMLGANSRSWPLAGQFLMAAIGLVGATIAARLLGPNEYGVYFLGLTVTSVVGIASDICVGQAILIKAPGYEGSWRSWRKVAVFIAAAAAGLTLALTLLLSSNPYQATMWVLLCGTIPVTVGSMIPRAFLVLHGQLRFVAMVDVGSMIIGNALMIGLVSLFANQATAASGQLVIALVRLVVLESARVKLNLPNLARNAQDLREAFCSLWSIVQGIYQSQISGFLGRNGDNVIISIVLGPFQLAQYSRAYSLLLGPLQQAQMALTPMTLRDLAAAASRHHRYLEGLKSARFLLCLMLPTAGVMVICGERLVSVVLGGEWRPAGTIMAVSAGLAVSMTISLPARWLLIVGRDRTALRIDSALQFALLFGVLVGSLLWGLPGSMAINALVVGPATAIVEWMLLPNRFRRAFWKSVLPTAVSLTAIPAGLSVLLDFINLESIVYIAGCIMLAGLTTCVGVYLVHREKT